MSIIRLPYSFRPDVGRFSHLREIAVMQTFALNGLRDEYVPDANTAKAFSDDFGFNSTCSASFFGRADLTLRLFEPACPYWRPIKGTLNPHAWNAAV